MREASLLNYKLQITVEQSKTNSSILKFEDKEVRTVQDGALLQKVLCHVDIAMDSESHRFVVLKFTRT